MGGVGGDPTNFPKNFVGFLDSCLQNYEDLFYRISVYKAVIQLVISCDSFVVWYARYCVVHGVKFLGLVQTILNFSSWTGSHSYCRHKISQKYQCCMCLGLNSWKSILNYVQPLLICATTSVVLSAVAEKLFLW